MKVAIIGAGNVGGAAAESNAAARDADMVVLAVSCGAVNG